jgi:hypothetical protein
MTEIPKNLTYTIGSGSTIGIEPDHMVGLKSPQITHPGGFNLRVHYNRFIIKIFEIFDLRGFWM